MDRRSAIRRTGVLFGTGLAMASTTTLFHSCVWQKKETLDWVPRFFETDHALMIKQITHVLIPDPDIPNNIKNKISQSLDMILMEYTSKEGQESFVEGINAMDQRCIQSTGSTFLNAEQGDKTKLLLEEEKGFINSDQPTFYGTLKQMIFETFFRTEYAVTQLLYFDSLPGGYDGCVPLEEVGKIQHSNDIF